MDRFHGGLFVRAIASITLLFFTFVFYANPAASAVKSIKMTCAIKLCWNFHKLLLSVLGGVGDVIFVALALITIAVTFLILLATDLQLQAAGCPDGLRMLNALLILFNLLAGLVAETVGHTLVAGWIYTFMVGARLSK